MFGLNAPNSLDAGLMIESLIKDAETFDLIRSS